MEQFNLDQLPSIQTILDSMDPVAWTLVLLLVGAIVLGVLLTLNTRYTFLETDAVEATPDVLLARLKQDPTWLTPVSIINRLGAELTLELLRYGDQIAAKEWRYKWSGVREDLLRLLAQQNAFAPIWALARYYESEQVDEVDSLRLRRTALIHKLGQRRYIEPDPDGMPAQLRLYRHPAEQVGDLGFNGPTIWLDPDTEQLPVQGPMVEMQEIDYHAIDSATIYLKIQRTPATVGAFRIDLKKRSKMWIVVKDTSF